MADNPQTPAAGGAAPPAPVTVVYGANTGRYPDLVGRRVSEARDFLAEAMAIPRLPRAVVGGRGVETDYVLRPGDQLEFIEPQGVKG